jgi:hypothetical protein
MFRVVIIKTCLFSSLFEAETPDEMPQRPVSSLDKTHRRNHAAAGVYFAEGICDAEQVAFLIAQPRNRKTHIIDRSVRLIAALRIKLPERALA